MAEPVWGGEECEGCGSSFWEVVWDVDVDSDSYRVRRDVVGEDVCEYADADERSGSVG